MSASARSILGPERASDVINDGLGWKLWAERRFEWASRGRVASLLWPTSEARARVATSGPRRTLESDLGGARSWPTTGGTSGGSKTRSSGERAKNDGPNGGPNGLSAGHFLKNRPTVGPLNRAALEGRRSRVRAPTGLARLCGRANNGQTLSRPRALFVFGPPLPPLHQLRRGSLLCDQFAATQARERRPDVRPSAGPTWTSRDLAKLSRSPRRPWREH